MSGSCHDSLGGRIVILVRGSNTVPGPCRHSDTHTKSASAQGYPALITDTRNDINRMRTDDLDSSLARRQSHLPGHGGRKRASDRCWTLSCPVASLPRVLCFRRRRFGELAAQKRPFGPQPILDQDECGRAALWLRVPEIWSQESLIAEWSTAQGPTVAKGRWLRSLVQHRRRLSPSRTRTSVTRRSESQLGWLM